MSDKDLQRYRHYESMVKKARKTGIGEKPPSCAKCQYYQPDFKYRKCLYARCPYQRDTEIFRKRPLKKDKIPGPEVVKMDDVSMYSRSCRPKVRAMPAGRRSTT